MMKSLLSTLLVFFLTLSSGKVCGQSLRLEEYTWDNPAFRESFVGTFGIRSEIEPRLTPSDQDFLRETVLPLIEKNPTEAAQRVSARLNDSTSPVLYFILGNIQLQQNQTERARQSLDRALSLFPDFRRAHRSLALLEIREGDYDEAIPHWIEVIRLGGGDDQSYGLLGYSYLQQGQWTAATRSLENALVFRPDSRDIRRGLVHALTQSGRPESAKELVESLLTEDADDPQLWRLLANLHLENGDLKKTAATLEVAVRMTDPLPDTLFLLGGVYSSLGLPEKALAAYEKLLQLPATGIDFETAYRPVDILLSQRLWDETIQYASSLRSFFGRDLDSEQSNRVNASLVTASLFLNPDPAGIERAQEYAQVFPLNGLLHLAIGESLTQEDRIEEAILYLRRAAASEEHRYEGKLQLANLLVSEERYGEAISLLRELQEMQYNDRVAAFLSRLEEM